MGPPRPMRMGWRCWCCLRVCRDSRQARRHGMVIILSAFQKPIDHPSAQSADDAYPHHTKESSSSRKSEISSAIEECGYLSLMQLHPRSFISELVTRAWSPIIHASDSRVIASQSVGLRQCMISPLVTNRDGNGIPSGNRYLLCRAPPSGRNRRSPPPSRPRVWSHQASTWRG